MRSTMFIHSLGLLMLCLGATARQGVADIASPRSKTVYSVLREPLPAEVLGTRESDKEVIIEGPTFTYSLQKATGGICSLKACRQGAAVLELVGPADIVVDDYRLAADSTVGTTRIVRQSSEQIVLETEGTLHSSTAGAPELPYRLTTTVYNDGVVVSQITLHPRQDVAVRRGIEFRAAAQGVFRHCLHKTRSEHGAAVRPIALPMPGKSMAFTDRTSCLQVFSSEAALAIFTDGGGLNLSDDKRETAMVHVLEAPADRVRLELLQKIVAVGPGDEPFLLKADGGCTFRVGLSVAPNRHPHPRWRDLRMFVWAGDAKNPYPTDEEVREVARLGFTLFQMHRVGTPGEPRPPADQLQRVIDAVHASGMLFLWTENADLMYANAPRVAELRESGQWPLWQGFNYGGRYCATMDPYCDLVATCLASPNGLSDYRQVTWTRMFDKYAVDGLYLDDNLAYANCELWKEHGHPRQTYDCLIELHDVNWRRRQLFRQRCPHAVLVDHCSTATFLPVIADFDVHLYGEGYGFATPETYRDQFGWLQSMPAQGCIWPGDSESSRCAARVAYNFDLLTGGGQYSYLCWRLWPGKFPYAAGVTADETWFVRTYNLAQFYFGMYESDPCSVANSKRLVSNTAPQTYAAAYRNRAWGDWLIVLANMAQQPQAASLGFAALEGPSMAPDSRYALYDVHQRSVQYHDGASLGRGLADFTLPAGGLGLFCLRPVPANGPYHLWGGKRISEEWTPADLKLTCGLHGPNGLEDLVLLADPNRTIEEVKVAGKPAMFVRDPASGLVYGQVTFAADPIQLEAACLPAGKSQLPERPIPKLVAPGRQASVSAAAAEYSWTKVTQAAAFAERDGAGAATYDGKMWLLGGWGDDPAGGPRHVGYNDVWNTIDGLRWTQVRPNTLSATDVWEGRHCGGYAVFNNRMWIVGGDPLRKHFQNDVWSSTDGVAWQQATANAPWGQRNLHVTMVHDGKLWVMGGQAMPQFVPDVPEAFYNDVWNSTDGVNWTQVTARAPWSPRGMIQGSVEFQGRMWLLGGGTYDTPAHPTRAFYNEVWSSADGVQWQLNAVAPWPPRQYHSVAVFDNKMWVMAGGNNSTPGYNRNDVWYSADGVNWTELPNTPWPPRHAGTAFVHNGHLWMVAGSHPDSTPINDVWRLDKSSAPRQPAE